jgi:hypothetical protein
MVKLVVKKSSEYNLERREWQLPSVRNTCDSSNGVVSLAQNVCPLDLQHNGSWGDTFELLLLFLCHFRIPTQLRSM